MTQKSPSTKRDGLLLCEFDFEEVATKNGVVENQ